VTDKYALTGNWGDITSWSLTSGGAPGAPVPLAVDNVFLDANSGSIAVNVSATCANFVCTGYTSTLSGSSALAHTGDLFTLVAGMTYTYTGAITFTGANAVGGVTITRAGKTTSQNHIFNGVSESFLLADALSIASHTLTVTNGAVSSQGFDVTLNSLSANNTNTKTLDFTGSDLFVAGTITIDGTNTTFAAPDLVRFTRSATSVASGAIITAGVAFKAIEISRAPTAVFMGFGLTEQGGQLSIESLDFVGVANANFLSCAIGIAADITLDACDFPEGTELISSANGTQRTITTGTNQLTADGTMFRDIAISGGPLIATNSIDLGNNSGITFQNVGPYTHEIVGVTYDDNGDILGSCTCTATKEIGGEVVVVDTVTSDAVTGAYTLQTADNDASAYTVTWTKLGAPRGDAMCGITPTAP
jgi:hypothetical protein